MTDIEFLAAFIVFFGLTNLLLLLTALVIQQRHYADMVQLINLLGTFVGDANENH